MGLRTALIFLALTLCIVVALPLLALVLGSSWDDVFSALTDSEVLSAIGVSLTCAAAAVIVGLVFAVPAGYVLAHRSIPGSRILQAILDLPVVVPHPIIGIGLLLIFGRHRLIGAALRENFGLQVVSAAPGIILAMLVVSSPLIVKAAAEGFASVPAAMERAARSLGASERRVFFTVALPLAMSNIRAGALLAWARAVSEFGSIVILAYYPRSAPVLIWDRFSAYGLRAALAPSLLLLAACMAIFLLLQVANRHRPRMGEQHR